MDVNLEKSREKFVAGITHFEAQRYAEARVSFESALTFAPGRPSILANLGITLYRLGEWRQAIPVLQESARTDPDAADVWIYLGLAHEACAAWEPAATALLRALALNPQHSQLWLTCGQCQHRFGAFEAALQSFDQALRIDPECAQAWCERGGLLREAHRLQEAAACFEKALALGADPELNTYYLASVRGNDGSIPPPRRYVEALFDDYAVDFQSHLVEKLAYRGFEVLLQPLIDAGRHYHSVLDLGCGTGLCGPLIRGQADAVDGVDISRAMLEQARQLGIYRELVHADLGQFLAESSLSADLVLAADVFIYIGELSAVFQSIRRILKAAGEVAFTVELTESGQEIELLPSLRYAHSESYIRRLAQDSGFNIRHIFKAPIRNDQEKPVLGLYVYMD